MTSKNYPIKATVRQSPPVDYSLPVNDTWLREKTVIITGGASGLGAKFFREWAQARATVIVGDIDVEKGDQLVRNARKETGNPSLHFFFCDVTKWSSQVQFFKDAVKVSPHGGIDTVVANAGILDNTNPYERPGDLAAAEPPPPNLAVLDVNLRGVVFTTHLAMFYLPRNPKSTPAGSEIDLAKVPRDQHRDRHLLLVSSVAGLIPLPGNTLYTTSKHAIVGLFRNLRTTGFMHGIRVNMLCPYFVDSPMMITPGRLLHAGSAMAKAEDVVDAATRFVADHQIIGRAAVIGPKIKVKRGNDSDWNLVETNNGSGEQKAIWEAYADDFEDTELFTRNYVKLLNRVVEIRGWVGWLSDSFAALKYGLGWS